MHYGRLKFNAQEWRKENEIPDEMTDEYLEALWEIMATFVELAHEGKSSNN